MAFSSGNFSVLKLDYRESDTVLVKAASGIWNGFECCSVICFVCG